MSDKYQEKNMITKENNEYITPTYIYERIIEYKKSQNKENNFMVDSMLEQLFYKWDLFTFKLENEYKSENYPTLVRENEKVEKEILDLEELTRDIQIIDQITLKKRDRRRLSTEIQLTENESQLSLIDENIKKITGSKQRMSINLGVFKGRKPSKSIMGNSFQEEVKVLPKIPTKTIKQNISLIKTLKESIKVTETDIKTIKPYSKNTVSNDVIFKRSEDEVRIASFSNPEYTYKNKEENFCHRSKVILSKKIFKKKVKN
jgi:hypothetical protein